ncbi:MAG: MurR/RpiR family transcriptional regulator [Anaerococcus hydrogenalis]|uniref:MurR/RpiR family transcriptional regulator n=1 Tax=Anaerococcus hydrogenalis TaxID=33029 RepID=UPI00290B75C6|nr:MurR/RpiR family transcriptional regulator [Anaerococcus hydrogenalis]MDU3687411.1 MurR/RpiR family transcriptional regulator [Anaerococcus hydrogenalis]
MYSDLIRKNYANLSSGQKKVADFIIKNPELTSFQTIANISRDVGVSETTVIRLSYSLGFSSFSKMQEEIRKSFLANVKKGNYTDNEQENDIILKNKIILKEEEFIRELDKNISDEQLKNISYRIYIANSIFCVAGRNVHPAAKWLGMSLEKIKGNSFYSEIEGEKYYTNLMNINEESMVIVISLSRYSKISYEFTKSAKEKGSYVVSITDNIVSPVAQISDQVLLVKSKVTQSGFNSISATMAICDLLIAYYMKCYPEDASKRLKTLEEYYKNCDNLYFE